MEGRRVGRLTPFVTVFELRRKKLILQPSDVDAANAVMKTTFKFDNFRSNSRQTY